MSPGYSAYETRGLTAELGLEAQVGSDGHLDIAQLHSAWGKGEQRKGAAFQLLEAWAQKTSGEAGDHRIAVQRERRKPGVESFIDIEPARERESGTHNEDLGRHFGAKSDRAGAFLMKGQLGRFYGDALLRGGFRDDGKKQFFQRVDSGLDGDRPGGGVLQFQTAC